MADGPHSGPYKASVSLPMHCLLTRSLLVMLVLPLGLGSYSRAADRGPKVVVTVGGGEKDEGLATECRLRSPFGLDFASNGDMYIVELYGERLLKVDARQQLTWIGGTGTKGDAGDGAAARTGQFNGMHALAITKRDEVLLADTWNNRVRRYDIPTGTLQPFAGLGGKGWSGDGGPAKEARFNGVFCVALDPAHEWLVIVDLDNKRVRRMNLATGVLEHVAGTGKPGVPADGADAKSSPLVDPRAAAVGADGTIYILERSGHALRAVDSSGKIRTVVGTGKAGLDAVGKSGDDMPALEAKLNGPKHLCVDRDGTVLIADTENHLVRRYHPQTGRLTRVAGSGRKGLGKSGEAALACDLFQPHGVHIDAKGVLRITDSGNHRVLRYDP
jgi:hypothetical protein